MTAKYTNFTWHISIKNLVERIVSVPLSNHQIIEQNRNSGL